MKATAVHGRADLATSNGKAAGLRPSSFTDASAETSPVSALKRRVYLASTVSGSVIVVFLWLAELTNATPNLFVVRLFPLVLAGNVALIRALLRSATFSWLERLVLLGVTGLYVGQLFDNAASPSDVPGSAFTFLTLVLVAFITLPRPRAVQFVLPVYFVGLALPWMLSVSGWAKAADAASLTKIHLIVGSLSFLLYGLAWFKDELAREAVASKEWQLLAATDPLTGVANRRSIREAMERALTRQEALSVILLDLDAFKRLNDEYGHNVGDDVLRESADLLTRELRPGDRVGRWGGEEFLVVLPGTSIVEAGRVAERLRAAFATHAFPGVGHVTASFGVAAARLGDSPERLVGRADRLLYVAKGEGRNCVRGEHDPPDRSDAFNVN